MIFNCGRYKEILTGLVVKKKAFLEESSDEETDINYTPPLSISSPDTIAPLK